MLTEDDLKKFSHKERRNIYLHLLSAYYTAQELKNTELACRLGKQCQELARIFEMPRELVNELELRAVALRSAVKEFLDSVVPA